MEPNNKQQEEQQLSNDLQPASEQEANAQESASQDTAMETESEEVTEG